jgi:signal transduction histidine kinase
VDSNPLDPYRNNRLLSGLDPAAWDRVRAHLWLEHFDPREVIFEEGDAGDWLYLIGSGVVRISKAGRGGQQETLTFLEAGDHFGELAAFNVAPRSARASAVDDLSVARLERAGLEALMQATPLPVIENLSRALIERLRITDEHFVAELLTAERLSLIGSMADMIIHDATNLLSPAHGYLQLLRDCTDDPSAVHYINGTYRSLQQVLDMLQELRDFSGGASLVLRPERFELRELLEEIDEQYLSSLSPEIEVHRRIAQEGSIIADRRRLSRVLINLCKNAVEAMPGGGQLSLHTSNSEEGIAIEIVDTGCGIPPELLPRIFEPFVTHGKRNGTGLGMAIVRSIIDMHGGRISLESTVGTGTTVRIWLPMGLGGGESRDDRQAEAE